MTAPACHTTLAPRVHPLKMREAWHVLPPFLCQRAAYLARLLSRGGTPGRWHERGWHASCLHTAQTVWRAVASIDTCEPPCTWGRRISHVCHTSYPIGPRSESRRGYDPVRSAHVFVRDGNLAPGFQGHRCILLSELQFDLCVNSLNRMRGRFNGFPGGDQFVVGSCLLGPALALSQSVKSVSKLADSLSARRHPGE